MFEYKIQEIKKQTFMKRAMKTEQLQEILNENAAQGWKLGRIVSAEIGNSLNIGKAVMLVIFIKEN